MFGGEMAEKGEGALRIMATIMMLIKILPKFLGKIMARRLMPVSPDDEIIPWINSKKRFSKDFLTSMKDSTILNLFSVRSVKKIQAPTILIMGDHDLGAIISEKTAQEMKKLIPDLPNSSFKRRKHDIRRAKFDEYMAALKNF